ncbi:glycosyltransferase family 2 protein [Lacihabitans lacunae]|uniref:Glycosyltransferase family 2 protein n=1 Tax=Lacihabitans lacunae TaxID=1028214 RepID=A0ABV7YR58_9BACT
MYKTVIIILNWNGADLSIECINSIKKLKNKDFKILLVDNGSGLECINQLEDYLLFNDEIELLKFEKNEGFARGNNLAIDYVKEKYNPQYFVLLNNDTIVSEDFLNGFYNQLELFPNAYAFTSKVFYYDQPEILNYAGGNVSFFSGIAKHFGDGKVDQTRFKIVSQTGFMFGCSCLITRDSINRIGLFDEFFFANCEDTDYSLRIIKSGHDIIFCPDSVVFHKSHQTFRANKGKSFAFYLSTRNIIYLQRKHLNNLLFPFFIIYFIPRWVLYLSFKLLRIKDYKSTFSIIRGFKDGLMISMKYKKNN